MVRTRRKVQDSTRTYIIPYGTSTSTYGTTYLSTVPYKYYLCPCESMSWTEHTSASGRKFYYDRVSGKSQWDKPSESEMSAATIQSHVAMQRCADSSAAVCGMLNAIIKHCGVSAIPTLAVIEAADPFCQGGRGGAYVSFVCVEPACRL